MRRLHWLLEFVVLTSLLTGYCWASSGSVFAGSWTGNWVDRRAGQNGTFTITINSNGQITSGAITNAQGLASEVQNGAINASGAVSFDYSYRGVFFHCSGRWHLNNGNLTGTQNWYHNGVKFGGAATTHLHQISLREAQALTREAESLAQRQSKTQRRRAATQAERDQRDRAIEGMYDSMVDYRASGGSTGYYHPPSSPRR